MYFSQVVAIVLLFFSLLLYHGVLSYAKAPESTKVPAFPTAVNVQAAARNRAVAASAPKLLIPSIGVHAAIENVTLTKQGSMGVPKDPLNAGWYALGPKPGEKGSAVIDGHVNWYYGATGVFKDLKKVKPGDKIMVQDEKGVTTSFVVREIRKFDAAADATAVFRSADNKAHLNLITCDGTWNKLTQQYSERLVVFADKIVE